VCESYKFSERVQLDSIVHNELGSTREIAVSDGAGGCVAQLNSGYFGAASKADHATLPFNVVNLRYDCTPIGNISAIATEIGLIPATSVPVLLRELRAEMERNSALDEGIKYAT
jgi:translation initiation factor eIF-2B subunit delta